MPPPTHPHARSGQHNTVSWAGPRAERICSSWRLLVCSGAASSIQVCWSLGLQPYCLQCLCVAINLTQKSVGCSIIVPVLVSVLPRPKTSRQMYKAIKFPFQLCSRCTSMFAFIRWQRYAVSRIVKMSARSIVELTWYFNGISAVTEPPCWRTKSLFRWGSRETCSNVKKLIGFWKATVSHWDHLVNGEL